MPGKWIWNRARLRTPQVQCPASKLFQRDWKRGSSWSNCLSSRPLRKTTRAHPAIPIGQFIGSNHESFTKRGHEYKKCHDERSLRNAAAPHRELFLAE